MFQRSSISFSEEKALAQIDELEVLLATSQAVAERAELMPFFKENRHAAASLGLLHPEVWTPTLLDFEYSLYQKYRADLIVGDETRGTFLVVELENAGVESIFESRGRKEPYWSPRFLNGFSQLVDWLYTLDRLPSGSALEDEFGRTDPSFYPALIVGRREAITRSEAKRLRWYREKVVVDSKRIIMLTFDDVVENVRGIIRRGLRTE